MDARDLMIGNYVYYNDKIISIAPKAIMEFYYLGDTHSDSKLDRRDYKPIPLTEDILVKCGFEKLNIHKDKRMFVYSLKGIDIIRTIDNGKSFFICDFAENEINYLHEVQNLIKAILRKELEIKL